MYRRRRPNKWYDDAVRDLQDIDRRITGMPQGMPARAHLLARYERIRTEVERLESRAFGVGDSTFEQDRTNTRRDLDALLDDVQGDEWYRNATGALHTVRSHLDALGQGGRAAELWGEYRSLRARIYELRNMPNMRWQRYRFHKWRAECNMRLDQLQANAIKSSEDKWQQDLSTINQHRGDYARASLSDNVGIPVPGTGSRSDNRSGSPPRRQRHQSTAGRSAARLGQTLRAAFGRSQPDLHASRGARSTVNLTAPPVPRLPIQWQPPTWAESGPAPGSTLPPTGGAHAYEMTHYPTLALRGPTRVFQHPSGNPVEYRDVCTVSPGTEGKDPDTIRFPDASAPSTGKVRKCADHPGTESIRMWAHYCTDGVESDRVHKQFQQIDRLVS
ncbi:hypothetical protein EXIGLDRAFT_832748, partial [Exidia glandulosa HHB12029]